MDMKRKVYNIYSQNLKKIKVIKDIFKSLIKITIKENTEINMRYQSRHTNNYGYYNTIVKYKNRY